MPHRTAPKSRQVIDAALDALGSAAPIDIARWWEGEHGDLPVTADSIRQTLSRWDGRRYLSVPGESGVYRKMTDEEKRAAKRSTAAVVEGASAAATFSVEPGTLLKIDLPNGTTVTVAVTIGQDGPPLCATARVERG